MVEEITLDLSNFRHFFFSLVDGYKTEHFILKNYRYPNLAEVLDVYVDLVKERLGFEPDYELAVKFVTTLDYYIQSNLGKVDTLIKEIKMKELLDYNNNLKGRLEVVYE
jgi:hypothetical protein